MMRHRNWVVAWLLGLSLGANLRAGDLVVVSPRDASPLESLAAREVRRYVYLRTGRLPALVTADSAPAPSADAIVVARRDRPLVQGQAPANLGPEQFALQTRGSTRSIVGGDDVGTLYGAYRFAETLGVRFYLHGDVIPDEPLSGPLPTHNEVGKPLFATRGIQPFHDFPEGPDWWDADDYCTYVSQLAKMRMNFLGLHCYPEGGVGPEPLVWIGQMSDADDRGRVQFSYPAQWANTARPGMWGYAALPTAEFSGGASLLFPTDPFGPAVMNERMPAPADSGASNTLFDRTGALLEVAFGHARSLGIRTCLGTETPLAIPKLVQERLRAQGKDPADPQVVSQVYEGMFRRIMQSHTLDVYWLWTPEGWTWGGNKASEFEATAADIRAALAALERLGNPFPLATCGWVLGPQNDRSALDRLLPKSSAMSCINRQVGHAPVEPAFAQLRGRPTWAIPWMENDPNLVGPQPWVGRMRYDAADARRLGCSGVLGIHWRTKALAPNVAALADACWDQSWLPSDFASTPPVPPDVDGSVGGEVAAFASAVTGAGEPVAVYQTVRYGMEAYRLKVPNGTYTVTLQFNEPHYHAAGQRVFGVSVQGKTVVEGLDLYARHGANHAFDLAVPDVAVSDGRLRIEFLPQVEFPCIAGIVVTGQGAGSTSGFVRKINCGGDRIGDYEADLNTGPRVDRRDRAMPVADFYADFARANFGPEVAAEAGRILATIDGVALPESTTWIGGPGGLKILAEPWEQVRPRYGFVAALAALESQVQGAGNRERFRYWLTTYRAMAVMAELGCTRGALDRQVERVKAAGSPSEKGPLAREALALRLRLARLWETLMACQVSITDTPGELGTLANLEQHNRKSEGFLSRHDAVLAEALGQPLPDDARPSPGYTGPARVTVLTARSQAAPGESLAIQAVALDARPFERVELCWRPLGDGSFVRQEMPPVAGAVYRGTLPACDADLEYHIEARTADGRVLVWPPSAPRIDQTIVRFP